MRSDFELLDDWRAGDNGAGNALFQRYFDSIYRFFETKTEADTDELVQSTFLACVRSRDKFRKHSSFRTYLFTIARHELYRYWRRHRNANKLDFGVTSLVDLGTTPTGKIARDQDHLRLLQALHLLPLRQQCLLELHYWEDMGIAQLAEVFEVNAQAMRTRLSRARKALREQVQALGDAPIGSDDSADFDAWARSLRSS